MAKLCMSEENIKRLIRLAEPDERDFCLLWLLASTGFKIGEVLNLRRSDVMVDGEIVGALRVRRGNKWLERPLRDEARRALGSYLKTRQDQNPWLFIGQSPRNKADAQRPLSRSAVHLIVKEYLREIYPYEIVTMGAATHVLRRSIARLIWNKTGRIEASRMWLGLSSDGQTKRYLEIRTLTLEEVNSVVADLDL